MNYEKRENRCKSDKSMTDKRKLLKINFVKLHCHFVKFFAIEST